MTPPDLPAEIHAAYELGTPLGRGAQGWVFRATQRALGREVVLKILRITAQEDATRALREAKALAELRHPAVVELLDFAVHGEWLCMAYPDEEARALSQHPEKAAFGEPARLVRLLDEVLGGLVAAHEAGILHRDVKPANILVTPGGGFRLIDFGLALDLEDDERLTQTGFFLGTPLYAAPDQAFGKDSDPRDDLYSLGVVADELARGRNDFAGKSVGLILQRHLSHVPERLDREVTGFPAELASLLESMLAKDREERPASAEEARAWLARVQLTPEPGAAAARGGTEVLAPPPGAGASLIEGATAALAPAGAARQAPTGPPPLRGGRGPAAALLVLATLGLGAWLATRSAPPEPRPAPAGPPPLAVEAWASRLAQDLEPASELFVDAAGGLARASPARRPRGTQALLSSWPDGWRRLYARVPALREARDWLRAGGQPAELGPVEVLRDAERPLRERGVPPPFGPLLGEAPGRLGPGPESYAEALEALGPEPQGWEARLVVAAAELELRAREIDAFLAGPAPAEDSPLADLHLLYRLRTAVTDDDRPPHTRVSDIGLAMRESRALYGRLVAPALGAYRRLVHAALRAVEARPERADPVALATLELTLDTRGLLAYAVGELPEELFGAPLPRQGAMAMLTGRILQIELYNAVTRRRLEEPGARDPGEEARAQAGACLLEAAEVPVTDEVSRARRRLALLTLWRFEDAPPGPTHREEWLRRTQALLGELESDARFHLVTNVLGRVEEWGAWEDHEASLRRLLEAGLTRTELARFLPGSASGSQERIGRLLPELASLAQPR